MLPLISTYPIHNLRLLLAEPIYRQQHICSNVITPAERSPLLDQGFLGDSVSNSTQSSFTSLNSNMMYKPGLNFPHQFDIELREKKSFLLYKNLNLKTCIWQFDAWYEQIHSLVQNLNRIVE